MATLKQYQKMLSDVDALGKQITALHNKKDELEKIIAKTRKEIRSQVQSSNTPYSRTAVLKYKGRTIKVRKNRYSAIAYENGQEIGTFNSVYEIEFALATGQL